MKRTLPLAAGFVSGGIIVAAYCVKDATLARWGAAVVSWRNIVAAFSLGIGAVNLVQSHVKTVARRGRSWEASVLLLVSLAGFTVVGLMKGTSHPVHRWGFEYLYQPVYSGISSLLAFMITSASYRAFRFKDWQSALLVFSAVVVILGQVGIGGLIYRGLPGWSSWIMSFPNMAGMRGITIGGALGAIALSLRVLLGLERAYLGGDR